MSVGDGGGDGRGWREVVSVGETSAGKQSLGIGNQHRALKHSLRSLSVSLWGSFHVATPARPPPLRVLVLTSAASVCCGSCSFRRARRRRRTYSLTLLRISNPTMRDLG